MGYFIQGDIIGLRAMELQDVDLLYKWENDVSVWALSNTQVPFSRFLLEEFVSSAHADIYATKQLRLMIDAINNDGTPVTAGCIDIFDFDPAHRRAGVGILIARDERKKGYAKQALQLLIQYAFEVLHLHQIYCNILVENKVSLDLFQKEGFTIIGTKKDWIFAENKWHGEYILQLIGNK